jgi:hypothetical protein
VGVGADSAYRLWTPRPFTYVSAGQWPNEPLSAEERARYAGAYDFDGKTVRVWEEGDVLNITPLFGAEDGAIQLVPLGNHLFAYGRYVNGRLTKNYWSDDRVEFRLEDGRVVGFDDRSAAGAV